MAILTCLRTNLIVAQLLLQTKFSASFILQSNFKFKNHYNHLFSATNERNQDNNVNEYLLGLADPKVNARDIKVNTANKNQPIDVVMKFGGSSLANSQRIDHVAHLIKNQIEAGYVPRAVVCSAMGRTTNTLLSSGDFALGKNVVV